MTVIHKQELAAVAYHEFSVPGEVQRILDIQYQNGVPVMWYEVDTTAPCRTTVRIDVVGTGNVSSNRAYIATTQVSLFVWHWYGDYEVES